MEGNKKTEGKGKERMKETIQWEFRMLLEILPSLSPIAIMSHSQIPPHLPPIKTRKSVKQPDEGF